MAIKFELRNLNLKRLGIAFGITAALLMGAYAYEELTDTTMENLHERYGKALYNINSDQLELVQQAAQNCDAYKKASGMYSWESCGWEPAITAKVENALLEALPSATQENN
jgi:hypothetical protein